jgi:hypothetical protein
MYITDVPTLTREGKLSHLCTLLRESYRQNGKVKNRTLANLTHCNPKEVDAMRLTLKYKDDLTVLRSVEDIELEQGMSVGAAWAVYAELNQAGFHYITAITRPEIEKLLKTGVFQMGLFDKDISKPTIHAVLNEDGYQRSEFLPSYPQPWECGSEIT